jgi:hypothetical protein
MNPLNLLRRLAPLPAPTRAALATIASLAAALAAPSAIAGYFQWETVELPADSGAACGNGTPYRFFVNRAPGTRDLVLVYEGGGACWDQEACLGRGPLSAANPDGIPPDYLMQLNSALFGNVTPFSGRNSPFQAVQTQAWNVVFLPYCTGDVHSGSAVRVYDDSDPANPRVQYHRGQANVRAAAAWLRADLGQPRKLLATGFSAGGVGSTTTYTLVREALEPTGAATLLADSGPLMSAPRGSAPEQSPSIRLHETIRPAWGLDEPGGLVTQFAALPGFDAQDLGTIGPALARRWPEDRFGYLVFRSDTNFSAFSYEKFYDDISGAPNAFVRRQRLFQRWEPDIQSWLALLGAQPNVAWHVAGFRNFNDSHCLTVIDFSGTGIQELGIADIGGFVDAQLDRGTPTRAFETDQSDDYRQPLSWGIRLVKLLLRLFD